MSRARVPEELLERVRKFKRENPQFTKIDVAKKFGVSLTIVEKFTLPSLDGLTVKEIYAFRREQSLKDVCKDCGTRIANKKGVKGEGKCISCNAKDFALRTYNSRKMKKVKILPLEKCDDSPVEYHHWMLDRFNQGVCKYCDNKKDFHQDDE